MINYYKNNKSLDTSTYLAVHEILVTILNRSFKNLIKNIEQRIIIHEKYNICIQTHIKYLQRL